jgi:hypothetical protein
MSIKSLNGVMDKMSEELQSLAMVNRFPYIFSKAELYLKIGPEKYRKADYFKLPDESLAQDELAIIESGCKQILEGKGLTKDNPFSGLDIQGFRQLFEVFHFEVTGHKASRVEVDGKRRFVDAMFLRHAVDNTDITYYNMV